MASSRTARRPPGPPILAAALIAVLVLAGALIWFRPYLTREQQPVAEVPGAPAMFTTAPFSVRPREQACMRSVTIDPASRLAEFHLLPATRTPRGGPPVDLVLSAPGYRAVASVPGGYPGGGVSIPFTPPRRTEIGTACFVNEGATTVVLVGTIEPRTVSRSETRIAGKPVVGDIALTFSDNRSRSLVDRLGEVFGHASNLTDRLLPVWLIWALAIVVAIATPGGMIAAFYLALREDETAAGSSG